MKFYFKNIAFVLLISVAFSCNSAQTVQSQDSLTKKYASTITAEELKVHLDIIASDEMEGRNTGSPGQKKAGEYLIKQYKADNIAFPKGASDYYQRIPASFFVRPRGEVLPDSENIWAYIEGTEKPNEIVVVSAHYDHVGMKDGEIYNGADDDGSGTSALLEIAQAFAEAKKNGHGPKRSVLILHVTGEEHGLHGSRFYSLNPIFPLANTVADINIDMIGRRDKIHPDTNNYIYVIGADRLSTELHDIVEKANRDHVGLELDYRYNAIDDPNRYYFRSDHYHFAKNGIPSVFFFNGVHDDYHKPTDTPEKIEYDAFTKRTRLAFLTAWEVANRPEKLKVDKDGK